MGNEISYQCKDFGKYKDCKGTIVVAKEVIGLMAEKGESLPARCPNCEKEHRFGKRETRQNYFQQTINLALGNVVKVNFLASGFTAHHDRKQSEDFIKPDPSGMQIRITDDHIRELYQKLYENQVVILASPTGTGKSVYVLYRLLEAPTDYQGDFVKTLIHQGQIIQTQPFTYAAASIPETVSKKELGASVVGPMGILGISHRGREDYSRHNIGVEVTDGKLRNFIRDGRLGQYSLVMIDEAHKRSVNIDNLLNLLQYQLPFYPHLKVIVASATINLEEFKEAFERNGISTDVMDLSLTLEETINYHVHYWKSKTVKGCDCWMCQNNAVREKFWSDKKTPPEESELPSLVSSFVLEILKNTKSGGILAFLTGEDVIENTSEVLNERMKKIPALKNIRVIPIYSALGQEKVERRFKDTTGDRRVLLVTDIAETSHTLPDIVYEIESGYIKQYQWDPQDMTSTLPTIRHSQAGCRQRFGRVGRTQKGYVYCLYEKGEFEGKFKMQTTPEVFRSPIDETLLTAKAAGISQELKFIGSPDDRQKFNAEIERAKSTINDEGYTDEIGNITDDGLEIFHIPLSAQKKALLDLADEQNCLVEMATFLSIVETADGNPTIGADAINPKRGLMVWDPRWKASTKIDVWRIHEALKNGCADDLDFALKLADCFLDMKKNMDEETGDKLVEKWAEQNFLNYDTLTKAFKAREEMIEIFRLKAGGRKPRDLDITLANKIRLILASILRGRLVDIEKRDGKLVYRFPEEESPCGIIPEACVGGWQEGDKALLVTAIKKKDIFDGQQKWISKACTLVRSEPVGENLRKENFLDQKIFIGSKVSVIKDGEDSYIGNVLKEPAQVNVVYGERLDFAMLMDDYLRKGYKASVTFSEEDARKKFTEVRGKVKLAWQDSRRAEEAKVVGWRMDGKIPCALVIPFDERQVLQSIKDKKNATVKIERVFVGPEDRRGWVLAKTAEGVEFSIETADLSLSNLDYGLKCLEGKWLDLPVKEVNVRGVTILSNIKHIISGLEQVKEDIIELGQVDFNATIDKIDTIRNTIRNTITAFVVNNEGLLYTFQIDSRAVGERFRIGDEIPITLTLKKGNRYAYRELEDYQAQSRPNGIGWDYDRASEKLFSPYFLDEESLKDFEVEDEFKEKLFKNSWAFGFIARINIS